MENMLFRKILLGTWIFLLITNILGIFIINIPNKDFGFSFRSRVICTPIVIYSIIIDAKKIYKNRKK